MTIQVQTDLADFRDAARRRDHEALQLLLKRLLLSLDYYYAVALVVERLHEFLDIFESYYPDEVWVRQLLVRIVAFGTGADEGVAEAALQQDFAEAGTANYIKAVYDLTQAMQPQASSEVRLGYMVSAIVNSIMAELAEAWYGDNPSAWAIVRNPQHPDATVIAYTFWIDPQTVALDTALWLTVADRVEATIMRLAR